MTEAIHVRAVEGNSAPYPTVSVVIPALNEERNLAHVAERMPASVDEVVFVNGPSVDNTAEVARDLWPDAIHITQTRKGKGNALACGISAASGDIIVTIDADGSTDPAEIPRYVDALLAGADYAKGSRFISGGGSADITRFRRFGNRGLNTLVNVLFATDFTDLCYGYNAFWRRCLDVICLPDIAAQEAQWGDGFEVETLINTRVAVNQLKIVEVFSYEASRIHGVSNLNAVADGFRVLKTIRQEFRQSRVNRKRGQLVLPQAPHLAISPSVESTKDDHPVNGRNGLHLVDGHNGVHLVNGHDGVHPVNGHNGVHPVNGHNGVHPVNGHNGVHPVNGHDGLHVALHVAKVSQE